MNRYTYIYISFLSLFILGFSHGLSAQNYKKYNISGEEAFEKKDFHAARTWFSEGLDSCDLYSINRLTAIWLDHESMRRSMNVVMKRCLNCLEEMAIAEDRDAMIVISDYYKYGIATPVDEEKTKFWLNEILNTFDTEQKTDTVFQEIVYVETPRKPRKSILSNRFYSFISYTYSPTMPVGITIGGFSKYGVYASFKTSLSAPNHSFKCNNKEVYGTTLITEESPVYWFDDKKWHSYTYTGGILLPLKKEKLYLSLGGGYGEREYYRQIKSNTNIINGNKSAWCLNTEASYKGYVLEAGGVIKIKRLLINVGVNTIKCKDFDFYAGVGLTI